MCAELDIDWLSLKFNYNLTVYRFSQLSSCHTLFYFINLLVIYISKYLPNLSTLCPFLDIFLDGRVDDWVAWWLGDWLVWWKLDDSASLDLSWNLGLVWAWQKYRLSWFEHQRPKPKPKKHFAIAWPIKYFFLISLSTKPTLLAWVHSV